MAASEVSATLIDASVDTHASLTLRRKTPTHPDQVAALGSEQASS